MRHLYAHGGQKTLLSKNPAFSPKIQSLIDTFPDARFIYLVRDPVETCTSTVSWFSVWFNNFSSPTEEFPYKDETIELMKLWYSYPREVLARLPRDRYLVIQYDDFVADPESTIIGIYKKFGVRLSPRFARTLKNETQKARHFKSSRETTAESIGMSKAEIRKRFADVAAYIRDTSQKPVAAR
ncbi:MAG TPA: sulfotransferase [Spirochaetia bacterium]|nr:sulfotransferase [Spirochaetia bacterium]